MRTMLMNYKKTIPHLSLFLFIGILSLSYATAQKKASELPKGKQTSLGLYITSKEAYDMWKKTPEKVKILDVRTPEEYLFVGHAEMASNISLYFQSFEWDMEKERFPMVPNPDFIEQVKKVYQTDDLILITCRSGGRSARATDQLAEAGFKNVYTITDGFEGDKVKDETSVFEGQRMVNGWKNSGIPYTYNIDPKLMPFKKEK